MHELASITFGTTLAAVFSLGVCMNFSLIRPDARVWPPPGRHCWQFRSVWGLTLIATVGIVLGGVLDWNSGPLDLSLRLPMGTTLALAGLAFARFGMTTLGRHATLGLEGTLIEGGLYRWTRNPQYVGDIVALLGWAILCNSGRTWWVAVLAMACFALTPFAEEPWLREQYGEAYDTYRRRVPRFLGRPARPSRTQVAPGATNSSLRRP